MKLTLQTPIENLYMVGEKYSDYLKKYLNIHTVEDLIYHFPFRYDDLSQITTAAEIKEGEKVTLSGQILSIKNIFTRNGKQMQQAVFSDGTNTLPITWFNQPYLEKTLTANPYVNLAGKVASFRGKLTLTSPQFEINRGGNSINRISTVKSTHTGRLVPVYPETALVSSKWLRSRIKPVLKQAASLIPDFLPAQILEKEKLLELYQAIKKVHFPQDENDVKNARKRLGFDELFLLQLQVSQRKAAWQAKNLRQKLKCKFSDLKPFLDKLPFDLTDDQKKSLQEIIDDLNQNAPMNRLLEGDVGSGKTVVAAAAIFLACQNNCKSVVMAPTEVLANQHLQTLTELLKPHKIKIGFFTGANKSKGDLDDFDVYLGTHALLWQKIEHKNVGLVIIDEQHRFGVEQRAKIIGSQNLPHVLTMTATPIPRTAALTLYGDLSLSLIKQMPKGRKKVKTWLIPPKKKADGLKWIEKEMKKTKSQAFFIYPLIEESDKGKMAEVKAATVEFEKLRQIYPKLSIGLMHGKLKSKEKKQVMQDFADKKYDILVSTTVVEVGIDVTNATIMVIEDAQRFGLAQLHQLRGRVGRGDKQSYCLLFASSSAQDNQRLKAMETIYSGIELAEVDLKMRGPGQLYGTMQSGFLDLKIASFNDKDLINVTYNWAQKVLPNLEKYPLLQEKLNQYKITHVQPN